MLRCQRRYQTPTKGELRMKDSIARTTKRKFPAGSYPVEGPPITNHTYHHQKMFLPRLTVVVRCKYSERVGMAVVFLSTFLYTASVYSIPRHTRSPTVRGTG